MLGFKSSQCGLQEGFFQWNLRVIFHWNKRNKLARVFRIEFCQGKRGKECELKQRLWGKVAKGEMPIRWKLI